MWNSLTSLRGLVKTASLILANCFVAIPLVAEAPEPYDHKNQQGNQALVRVTAGTLSDVESRFGLQVLHQHDPELALVEIPNAADFETLTAALAVDPDVVHVEAITLASLPTTVSATPVYPGPRLQQDLQRPGTHAGPCSSAAQADPRWAGYASQGALQIVDLPAAQSVSPSCGAGVTVAIIDTGVDPDHPALAGSLLPGYDFLNRQAGQASEWSSLRQSVQAILEENLRATAAQSVQAILEGDGTLVMLDSSLGIILDPTVTVSLEGETLDTYFGHGTMVAGLVRLAAPGASIMPLRVFDSSGTANLYDIVDAIYYAVDHGADVINMSFSMATESIELRRALQFARQQGVVTIAAAGNEGAQVRVYPAANNNVLGIASTTEHDQLSSFSNFGPSLVRIAAPGDGVISAFPGDHYAAGWGTSFAAPLVAGTVALMFPLYEIEAHPSHIQKLQTDLEQGSEVLDLGNLIGRGRLDALESFREAATGHGN